MSSPRAVRMSEAGPAIAWWSRHDETCEVCERVTSLGIGENSEKDRPEMWICLRCLLEAICEAME